MIDGTKSFSSFSVNNVSRAMEFYTKTLGMKVTETNGILKLHIKDNAAVLVYPKPENHVPAEFTVLNFPVKNIETEVEDLSKRGVKFEKYDTEYIKTDGKGIFRGGGPLIAWFKDPAGNIFSVMQDDSAQ